MNELFIALYLDEDVDVLIAELGTTGEAHMTTLRTTVIMKTDIRGSTVQFRALPEVDLDALLTEHRQFVSRLAAAHNGRIVKPEGDGFWIVFPSVTAGALAAMSMQEELRLSQPTRGDNRLAMRIVLSLGDVLHQEGALVGDAVVLAARIEGITPPDEIYLSVAAWLAVNQAEVRTSFVDAFPFKGFPEPVPVYRIEQTHRTRVITDQYIVITDLRGFSAFSEAAPMTVVEKSLDWLLDLVGRACLEFGGTTLFNAGDGYFLTFPDASLAMAAVERLTEGWGTFERREGLHCPMKVVVHQGVLYAFRSYLYGDGLNVAERVERATSRLPPGNTSIFVTGQVRRGLLETPWDARLQLVDVRLTDSQLAEIEIYRML